MIFDMDNFFIKSGRWEQVGTEFKDPGDVLLYQRHLVVVSYALKSLHKLTDVVPGTSTNKSKLNKSTNLSNPLNKSTT